MPAISPFEAYHDRYEACFIRHKAAYWAELLAVRALLSWTGLGLEISVGGGQGAFLAARATKFQKAARQPPELGLF